MVTKELKEFAKKLQDDSDKKLEKLMQRHMGGLKEDFEDQVKKLAEIVGGIQEKLDDMATDMLEVKSELRDIKFTIVSELPRKVDKKLFTHLEQRVRSL